MDIKNQLALLYTQKGELVTEIEIMQAQLQNVNKSIVKVRNILAQQPKAEPKEDKASKKKTKPEKRK